ncbi:CHASE2 domain-containing protein [Prochlorococcus sp. MIT 1303]|uniref:CHASE2 domain-containing protein n=1 Tax=Prochlorococcus sp. MIT 1303 TaxID=1723647 RepID=UPI0007BAE89C|nr:CHASE2 domain-containing protein [Prochlorococcus sp. MIT 1303]KZR62031.1 CHASE2 domain protein [Prochlorococcus sp. MIT 1303]
MVIGGIGLLYPSPKELLELAFVDAAQELRGPRRAPDGITVVAIDDFSLQQASNTDLSERRDLRSLQPWPWPRKNYATVLDRLIVLE